MNETTYIELHGKKFTYEQYRGDPPNFALLFAAAYTRKSRATCLCNGKHAQLYLTYRSGIYFLARMPETGHQHADHCPFYESPTQQSSRSAYSDKAIVEKDGFYQVNLGVPLTIKRQAELQERTTVNPASSTSNTSIKLLGLLHLLWQVSSNNRWFPLLHGKPVTKRHWRNVGYFLTEAVSRIQSKNVELSDLLYIIPTFDKERYAEQHSHFLSFMHEVLASGTEQAVKLKTPKLLKLVLGEIKSIEFATFNYEVRFKEFGTKFYLNKEVYQRAADSYALGLNSVKANDARCIAMASVSSTKKGFFLIENLALMPVTQNYIPFDSSYEKRIADLLVEQSRKFEKPMHYDHQQLTLPDFELLDTHTRIPMEIYGMVGNVDYNERKRKKTAIYRDSSTPYWSWDLSHQATPPSFPAPS